MTDWTRIRCRGQGLSKTIVVRHLRQCEKYERNPKLIPKGQEKDATKQIALMRAARKAMETVDALSLTKPMTQEVRDKIKRVWDEFLDEWEKVFDTPERRRVISVMVPKGDNGLTTALTESQRKLLAARSLKVTSAVLGDQHWAAFEGSKK